MIGQGRKLGGAEGRAGTSYFKHELLSTSSAELRICIHDMPFRASQCVCAMTSLECAEGSGF